MATRVSSVSIAVAVTIWCFVPRPAEACGPPPAIQSREILPPDGATGVPLNAQIRMRFRGSSLEGLGTTVQVRPTGGESIALDAAVAFQRSFHRAVALTPSELLRPGTTYEILDRLVPCEWSSFWCWGEELLVAATFTTGLETDETPPAFDGIVDFDGGWYSENESPCGTYSYTYVSLDWAAAADDQSVEWLRYNIYYDDGDPDCADGCLVASMLEGDHFEAQILCGGFPDFWPVDSYYSAYSGSFFVRATDLAGNEDDNSVRTSRIACNRPDDDGPLPGCRAAPSGGDPIFLSFLMTLALLRRRRR